MASAPSIPSDLEGPDFAEPWQAQAFACAIQLSRQGLFEWKEWVEVFSAEIKAHPAQPGESSSAAYYRQWLAALETIVTGKGAVSGAEIADRQESWRRAYLNTPHGQAVELRHARSSPGTGTTSKAHDHPARSAPTPVAVATGDNTDTRPMHTRASPRSHE